MSLLLLLRQSGPAVRTLAVADQGATVTDVLAKSVPRAISDRGATVSDVLRRTYRKTLTDTGVTLTDSIAKIRAPQLRSLTDRGALISEAVVVAAATGTIVGRIGIDSYVDGASAIFGQQQLSPYRISAFSDQFSSYVVASDADDSYYARLPLDTAQDSLASGPSTTLVYNVYCSWHGLLVDPERGSFAVVRAGGELEGLVGDRIRVTTRAGANPVSVIAYVNNVATIADDTEVSLSRRLFLEMAPLGVDKLAVTVEVVT